MEGEIGDGRKKNSNGKGRMGETMYMINECRVCYDIFDTPLSLSLTAAQLIYAVAYRAKPTQCTQALLNTIPLQ